MTGALLWLSLLLNASLLAFCQSPTSVVISAATATANDVLIQPQTLGQRIKDEDNAAPLLAAKPSPNVLQLISKINMNRVKTQVVKLTSFSDRYYQSATGLRAAQWLETQLKSIATTNQCDLKISRIKHNWKQFSLIARLNEASRNPVLVIGSHFDTNRNEMPGADDNASGTLTALEALTILCENRASTPKGPVEFHFYSAEEVGLLGSSQIAKQYKSSGRRLRGYINFDMTSVSAGGGSRSMGFFRSDTNTSLTNAVKSLAIAYTPLRPYDLKCSGGCSDNYSWNRAGYPAAWPFEGGDNRYYNTRRDTIQLMDFTHMKEFIKLAIAISMEL